MIILQRKMGEIMRNRDTSIDTMKSILIIFMILAHIIQFFPVWWWKTEHISNYVNLTTFSGFMFTFGYVCYKAYIGKEMDSHEFRNKMCRNFF